MKKGLIFSILFLVGITILSIFFFISMNSDTLVEDEKEIIVLELNGGLINAHVVRKPEDLRRGLSGREELLTGEGMWFDFGSETMSGIWMKDMKFPIDIVWVDKNYIVSHLESSISPDTYPKVFYPSRESQFVLEVASGTVEKYGLEVENRVLIR